MIDRQLLSRLAALTAFATLSTRSPSAHAETITATLQYLDGDGIPAPIASATVEIWRLDAPFWGHQRTVTTDASGRFSTAMPFVGTRTYALRVFATNEAAQVFQQDLYTQPFYREPGRDDDTGGAEILRTASSPFDVLDFSFTFRDTWARNHFNVADAILRGKAYADQRRDPRETDTIARVAVLMNSVSTFYDPVSHLIRLQPAFALDDLSVLHEYAHYLEERISSFFGIAANHDGCAATVGAISVVSPGYAWMEGFASYFAQAVQMEMSDVDGPGSGTLSRAFLESPSCATTSTPRSALEVFVAGALFDIHDQTNEAGDELCAFGPDLDTIIFQIFDRELDIGWTNPDIQLFVNAWIARGLDLPPLLSTIGTSGLGVTSPASVIAYDSLPSANLAMWRASAGGAWYVNGGTTTFWGIPGDIPVPADYDGDGLTDVAIWRPSDGGWYVIKSATGQRHFTQWGTFGDIPLPGDYDGDNETDYAVYRPSTEQLFVHVDSCGTSSPLWLGAGTPVVGDFDADGIDEAGVYLAASGWFRITRPTGAVSWILGAIAGGVPVVADYDGDGRADAAVYRPDTGFWHIRSSFTGATTSQWWGEPDDIPVPADYDGDGRADIASWTPRTGVWWILEADGPQWSAAWGTAGDVPVPAR